MVSVATFGIDCRWKHRILTLLPENPARILDLACGTGILTVAIARKYPQCRVVGVELRDEYLQHFEQGGCTFDPAKSTLWGGAK